MSRFNYKRRWKPDPHSNDGYGALHKTAVVESGLKHKDGQLAVFRAWKRSKDGVPVALDSRRAHTWIVTVTMEDGLHLMLRGTPRAALVERLRTIVELLYVGDLMEVA